MKKLYFFLALWCILIQSVQANVYFVTNNHVSGSGSFGSAITSANAHPGKDYIYFNIPAGTVSGRTIHVSGDSMLPSVTDTVVIDATTQPHGGHFGNSSAKIQITSADTASVGLVIDTSADYSEVYGFFINHFSNGIKVFADGFIFGSILHGNVISDCQDNCVKIYKVLEGTVVAAFVGVDTSGTNITSPNATGILIDNCKKVTIGGKQSNSRNIISGCLAGIRISDSKYITIQGNYIGTDLYATSTVPNTTGILVTQSNDNTKNITIGGDSLKYVNVISGNLERGLDLDFSESSIQGNMIGTDLTGTLHLGNGFSGIYFHGTAYDNVVGGLNGGEGNVIAFNNAEAVVLENSASYGIYVRGNRMFCNSQTSGNGGILLNGGNEGITPPTLLIVAPNFVAGSASPGVAVDIYSADSCSTCEGADYLGTVTADSNGMFFDTIAVTGKVTATVNDIFGNTSEFAVCKDSSVTSCVYAAFQKSKSKVCTNETVTFTDQTISVPGSAITEWNWIFGDGQTSSIQSPVISFQQGGTWGVTLVVTNSSGCTDTVVDSITVKDGVMASFTAPQIVCENSPVHFSDNSVAFGSSSIVSWYWDLGDGNHSTLPDFFYTYSQTGDYAVTLTIVNTNNCDNSFTDTVTVNPPAQAAFSVSPVACAGTPVQFTDGSLPSPGATLTSWLWNFGDGDTSSAQNPLHIFNSAGIHLVTLIAGDNIGCSDSAVLGVSILAGATANFTWTTNGTTVNFINTSTFNGNYSIQWTFGDGNSSLLVTPSHTYASFGAYEVCLVVNDSTCNVSDTLCQTVLITGIHDADGSAVFDVSPNPASRFIRISDLTISASIRIALFNSLGKEVLSRQLFKAASKEFILSLPALPEGVYWICITSDKHIVMKKLVISQK